jgi:SPP1 family predicted phage head-tail adaptor
MKLIKVSHKKDAQRVDRASRESKEIFCTVKDVSQTAFYAAKQSGMKPALIFIIRAEEYEGQTEVEYSGEKYAVARTYCPNADDIELTVEAVVGV